ncbi:hypothetical protein RI444_15325 [Paenarthrobacter sp. AT5]|uniref:hypothetical protein n=1 Tax=Paenarthrobacter TaxID=1742992 RepID=UPI001A98261B|nr:MULTISPECIES: hypothetical protein [Paenarthrobacter]QSZ53296.1 hypothetical protein AYX19_09945 [Paenarthrobacter ureafaciens]WOC59878.1 hypothetical protein RI444_15325 [Paenarthrobacter sp. AT5]
MVWVSHDQRWQDQKIRVYRSRHDEATRITAALNVRRQNLLTEILADDLDGLDTTTKSRRLQQTDDELDRARIDLISARAALHAEEAQHYTHEPREARR